MRYKTVFLDSGVVLFNSNLNTGNLICIQIVELKCILKIFSIDLIEISVYILFNAASMVLNVK